MSNFKWRCCLIVLFCFSCNEKQERLDTMQTITSREPQLVFIEGYNGHIMEPFLSRDGRVLFFNNLNTAAVNTNLHWSVRINDTLFQYKGELSNINTESLEGVPTMDMDSNFYYVHTGTYEQTFSTIYTGYFTEGTVIEPSLVENISLERPGWVNFDVEVSSDGNTLYFVDGRFDAKGGPYEADIVIARKENGKFYRDDSSEYIFQNINTNALEYAAAVTKDELEICFTRVATPLNAESSPKLYLASRNNRNEPFANVRLIENLSGFVEAATYTPDDRGLYFHQKENNTHNLYFVRK